MEKNGLTHSRPNLPHVFSTDDEMNFRFKFIQKTAETGRKNQNQNLKAEKMIKFKSSCSTLEVLKTEISKLEADSMRKRQEVKFLI